MRDGTSELTSCWTAAVAMTALDLDSSVGAGTVSGRSCYLHSPYAPVLSIEGISHYDRMAFACRFLDDEQLQSYFAAHEVAALARGALGAGLLLHGLTPAAMPLLQVYLNRTGDLQTTTLLVSKASPRFFKDGQASNSGIGGSRAGVDRVDRWKVEYRALLDRWEMYHQRCNLDIALGTPPIRIVVYASRPLRESIASLWSDDLLLTISRVYAFSSVRRSSAPTTAWRHMRFLFATIAASRHR